MEDIIRFFDSHAQNWDSSWKEEEFVVMRKILERSKLTKEDILLDIACGTGILVPFFLERGLAFSHIQGIDISPKMVEIFSQKFPDISVLCADFNTALFPDDFFTYIIIFNSFPHFLEPENLFKRVSQILKPGGKLVIAHSKTREKVDHHHEHCKGIVRTHRLIEDAKFMEYYEKYGFTDILIENSLYFYTIGIKK